MMQTLWTVCAWTGCCAVIAGIVVMCAAAVESLVVKWEKEQLRRIAASEDDDLPTNWREMDGERSLRECVDEIRLRKTGGA